MDPLSLSDEELKETLRRAREIAEQNSQLARQEAGLEEYLRAAEEVDIPRDALLQALRERLLLPHESFQEGQTVFAPSVDGYWYPAEVLRLDGRIAVVRFLSGGEHTVSPGDLRPLSLIPGRKLQADIRTYGWYSVFVEKYDPEGGRVRVVHDDWSGERETVPLRKTRLPGKLASPPTRDERRGEELARARALRWSLTAGGLGLLLGILLDRFLPLVLPF